MAVMAHRGTLGKSSQRIVMTQLVRPAAEPMAKVISIKKKSTANS